MDSVKHISRAASRFFSGTVLSRVTGMWREMVMAAAFGSLPAVAAFMIAYRFANLLRRLFGEGAMNSAFIPQFEELRAISPARAGTFFRGLSLSLMLFLSLLVIIAEAVLWGCLYWLSFEESEAEILRLTALMLPAIVAICLFGLNSALLNCERIYFLPSVAPAIFNVAWILGVVWLWESEAHQAMVYLSVVVVLAFILQWGLTFPALFKLLRTKFKGSLWEDYRWWIQDLRRMAKPLFLGILGVSATQINSAVDPLFARAADPEGPAFLWYAIRIQQLPLSLFGIALTGALLPPLARAIKANDVSQYRHFLQFAIKRSFSLIFPCMLAMTAVGLSSVNLLYGRGAFDVEATISTTYCLWAYSWALLPATFVLIFSSALYAQGNYRLSAISSTYAVLVNIALNALLVFLFHLGAASVAFATSVSAWFQCVYLAYHLKRMERGVVWQELLPTFKRVGIVTILTTTLTMVAGFFILHDPAGLLIFGFGGQGMFELPRVALNQMVICSGEALCFIVLLLLLAKLLKVDELLTLFFMKRGVAQEADLSVNKN